MNQRSMLYHCLAALVLHRRNRQSKERRVQLKTEGLLLPLKIPRYGGQLFISFEKLFYLVINQFVLINGLCGELETRKLQTRRSACNVTGFTNRLGFFISSLSISCGFYFKLKILEPKIF